MLTLTRDRLSYTQHCFQRLQEFAGCDYDHLVFDQGSTDGTREWLWDEYQSRVRDYLFLGSENVGINRGMNFLLEYVKRGDYDVIVKFDNDCELTQPNTLRDVARLTLEGDCLLSPRIAGLNNPPAMTGMFMIGDEEIMEIPQIGGIFTAAPARIYDEFRFDDTKLLDDDVELCWWFRGKGGACGYVKRLVANHYETTSGQHARFPDYFLRTLLEGKPAL